MTTVARDGRKRVVRLSAWAEIAQSYVAQPLSEGETCACMSLTQVLRLRIRRVMAYQGRTLCGFELAELGAALDLDPSVVSRDVQEAAAGLRAQAEELGHSALLPPRRGRASDEEDEDDDPSDEERRAVRGSRRSDRVASQRRSTDAI
jgi:hypothetical protein